MFFHSWSKEKGALKENSKICCQENWHIRRKCQFYSNQIILYVQEPLDLVFPLLQYTLSGASAASLCSSVSIVMYTKVLALEIALPKTSVTSESSTYVSASALPFITLVYYYLYSKKLSVLLLLVPELGAT